MRKYLLNEQFFHRFSLRNIEECGTDFCGIAKAFCCPAIKKVSKKQSLSVVLLYNLGEYKCLKDKRKRGKQAHPFHFVHLAGIEPARVLPH